MAPVIAAMTFRGVAILFLLGGAPVAPVAFHEAVNPSEFKDDNTRPVLMDEDCVGDLPLEVDESRAINMSGQGGKLGRQAGEESARCGAPMLREARAATETADSKSFCARAATEAVAIAIAEFRSTFSLESISVSAPFSSCARFVILTRSVWSKIRMGE